MRTTTRRDFLKVTGAALASASAFELSGCASTSVAAEEATELSQFDGVALAGMIRAGEITPLELVEDTLARIDLVNPEINAVIPELFDPEVALRRAARPVGDGPLAGLPVLLKNLNPYAEARVDFGSRLYSHAHDRGLIAGESSTITQLMLDSGLIITGVTNSPESGLIDTTEPVLHGPSRNPWNLAYTTGGSSGGAAAAVASGIAPFAHANDGGGSIRIPASHCGLFGLKPSRGREIGSGTSALSIANNLCVSRTVRDSAAFLAMIERKTDTDLAPVGWVEPSPESKRLRVGLALNSVRGDRPHPEVERAVLDTAELCEELGHEVREVELTVDGVEFADAFIGLWSLSGAQMVQDVPRLLGSDVRPEDVLERWTLGLAQLASTRGGQEPCVERATRAFVEATARMSALFETACDVLLTPVLRVPPFPLGYHDPMGDFDVVMQRVLDCVAYTPLQNATGMPGMSVPMHWTRNDLPVGVHFSTRRGGERVLLELAYELEEARPWADRLPPVHVTG